MSSVVVSRVASMFRFTRLATVVVFPTLLIYSVAVANELSIEETRQLEKLITELASQNPVPKEGGTKGGLIYPPGYDLEVEKVPYRVARQLTELGPKAFPILMRHSQDKAFSCVRESPSGAMRIISVGVVCEQIVAVQLNVFDTVGSYPKSVPDYFEAEVRGEKFATWWTQHQHQTLREMQIDAFEWAITEQQKLLEKWKPHAEAKQDTELPGQSYEELISRLKKSRKENQAQLKKLRKADEPLSFDAPIRKHQP